MRDYGREIGVGVSVEPRADSWRGIPGVARAADRADLDLVGVQDYPYQRRFLDAWALISTLVPQAERISFFPDGANLTLRPPAMFAEAAASLDVTSGAVASRYRAASDAVRKGEGTVEIHKKESVIPEGYEDLLRSTAVANIATIGPHGEPQNNPVWFYWDGRYLKFSQTKTRQKYRNLTRDPRIAVSIVDLQNPYRYLEVRGVVEKIEEDSNLDFTNALAKKYLGVDEYPYHRPGDERVVLFVRPDRTSGMA